MLEPESYTVDLGWSPQPFSGTVDVDRVLAEFEDGATIVLQALHHNWPPVADFCRRLEAALGEPVQANAYFTPRSAQGLAVHHDTHDVFVLQTAGKKHWRVYEPVVELPLQDQKYSKAKHGEPGEPVEDGVLEAGDTMYLPRGWLHDALTTDSESLHLTIGVKVYTWLDAARPRWTNAERTPASGGRCRQTGRCGTTCLRCSPSGSLPRKSRRASAGGSSGRAAQSVRASSRSCAPSTSSRSTRRLSGGPRRSPSSTSPRSRSRASRSRFPEHVEEEVAFAASAEAEFSAGDLPGDLDDAGRLVLVRRLVREGFLRIQL